MVGLIVPVMVNFKGFAELMCSVDIPVYPIVIDNWNDNIGVSRAWNDGLNFCIHNDIDVAIVSNDDIVFESGCLEKLVEGTKTHDLVTAVNTRDFPEYGSGSEDEPDYACFAVRPRPFVDKFGWFDEKFSPAYFEDNDMYYRIKLAGGVQKKDLTARMFHSGSVTQNWNGDTVVTSTMFEINRSYYTSKWGGVPGQEQYDAPFRGLTGKTYKDW